MVKATLFLDMSIQILEQLFDSQTKVRLLKLFLRNPDAVFTLAEIAVKIQMEAGACRRQIEKLESIKLVLSRVKGGRKYYFINKKFDFYNELGTLVLKSSPTSKKKILDDSKQLGKISLLVISGVFIGAENTRADIMIVGDDIEEKKVNDYIKALEAEVGKEIDFVVLTTADFKYRYEMFDRFIRDVFEKKHETLINKFGFVR